MKKFLFIIFGFMFFIPFSVNALTSLPATVTSNDNNESTTINLTEGDYTLPTFCATNNGCTITVDANTLKTVGKYNFGSGQEYFYIRNGSGATIYEEAGPNPATAEDYATNYNKIIINAQDFTNSGSITLSLGGDTEARNVRLVAPQLTTTDKDPADESDINDTTETANSPLRYIIIAIAVILLVIVVVIFLRRKPQDEILDNKHKTK